MRVKTNELGSRPARNRDHPRQARKALLRRGVIVHCNGRLSQPPPPLEGRWSVCKSSAYFPMFACTSTRHNRTDTDHIQKFYVVVLTRFRENLLMHKNSIALLKPCEDDGALSEAREGNVCWEGK